MINSKPPVPKFDLSKLINIEIDTSCEICPIQKADKRRRKEVISAIDCFIDKIPNSEISQLMRSLSIKMLNNQLLENMKSKKYTSIACALIIHSTRILLLPFTTKSLLVLLDANEKQVRKILQHLQKLYPYKNDEYVLAFVSQISMLLGFTFKFQKVCARLFDQLKTYNLINGEHEHIISAAIVKLAGDIIFSNKGGLILQVVADAAGCCDVSLKNFIKKVEPFYSKLHQELINHYDQNKL